MALGDGKAKQESQEIKGELSAILDAVSSIGDKLVSSFQDAVDEANKFRNVSEAASKTLKRGLLSDIRETVKNTEDLIRAQVKAEKGLLK
jgi:histidinol dehydrogenase